MGEIRRKNYILSPIIAKGGGYRTRSRVKALARCDGIALRAFPSLSCDIRRDAPVHGEKYGLASRPSPRRSRRPGAGPSPPGRTAHPRFEISRKEITPAGPPRRSEPRSVRRRSRPRRSTPVPRRRSASCLPALFRGGRPCYDSRRAAARPHPSARPRPTNRPLSTTPGIRLSCISSAAGSSMRSQRQSKM